ncbi:segregation and condensation protein A [Paeniglutamicibacter terrestris]|uniref:Segregation and condensation protein A n=1 Tax=Paeniglutamicibacter terrestris TaxID=2723403 RepID=A0ABX1G804_9MICC|nr:ScpA family protein [Paeniglutamicibacter terrestris]ASN38816.1 segregation/condensation protein A [Arthrobacter sp. 7749]NKG22149.1 segregation/condensation protein A [Paeniglutamicibacter terrestris]
MTAPAAENTATCSTVPDDAAGGFRVSLQNFSGPFDLLLSLIAKREMDITQIAMAEVTDEFIVYLKVLQQSDGAKSLDETTEFLVIASTLLELKAARLLPNHEAETEEDMALLEARDLLFARLLQYKAFKHAAGWISGTLFEESTSFPRQVGLEAHFAALLPELIFSTTPDQLARLALGALTPKTPAPTEVGIEHLHGGNVSVREQAAIITALLKEHGALDFTALVANAANHLEVVARFLALLEMYREKVIAFSQDAPLDALNVRWLNPEHGWDPDALHEEYGPAPHESTETSATPSAGTQEEAS